jgi:hypothetical protein
MTPAFILLLMAAAAAIAKDKPPQLDQKALTEIARAEAIAAHYETQIAIAKGPYDAAIANLRQKVAAQDAVCAKAGMKFDEPSLSCVKPPPPPAAPKPSPAPAPEAVIPPNNPPPAPMPEKGAPKKD